MYGHGAVSEQLRREAPDRERAGGRSQRRAPPREPRALGGHRGALPDVDRGRLRLGAAMRRVYAGSAGAARDRGGELVREGGERADGRVDLLGERAQVGRAATRAPRRARLRTNSSERSRNSRAAARSMTVVVRGQQQLGVERAQAADRRLVGGRVVVARRDQAVARAVVDAVGEHRVDHDRRAGGRRPTGRGARACGRAARAPPAAVRARAAASRRRAARRRSARRRPARARRNATSSGDGPKP